MRKLEKSVLSLIEKEPKDQAEVIRTLTTTHPEKDIRKAIRRLIELGAIAVTVDWKLRRVVREQRDTAG